MGVGRFLSDCSLDVFGSWGRCLVVLMPCIDIRLSGFLDKERSFAGGMVGNIKKFSSSSLLKSCLWDR